MASEVLNQVKKAEIEADKLVDDAKKKAKDIIEASKVESDKDSKKALDDAKARALDIKDKAEAKAKEDKKPVIEKAYEDSKEIKNKDQKEIDDLLEFLTERIVANGDS